MRKRDLTRKAKNSQKQKLTTLVRPITKRIRVYTDNLGERYIQPTWIDINPDLIENYKHRMENASE